MHSHRTYCLPTPSAQPAQTTQPTTQGRRLSPLTLSRISGLRRAVGYAAAGSALVLCSGCAVVAVADAAVTVVSTTVKVGATVVGTTVDVGAAGVRAVVGKGED